MQKFATLLLVVCSVLVSDVVLAQNDGGWKLFGNRKREGSTEKADTVFVETPRDTAIVTVSDSGFIPAVVDTSSSGFVEVHQDYRIRKLMDRQLAINDSLGTIPGFRVQIWSGSGAGSSEKAREQESKFLQDYPDVKSYLVWESPNFRLRIGNFRTQLEAMKSLNELRTLFPSAYIVKDQIELPELSNRK